MKKTNTYALAALGGAMFAISVNLFLIPASIYNGGIFGIAQLVRDFLIATFNLSPSFDIAGILNFTINVPILLFAWTRMSKNFVKLSLIAIIAQTVTLSLVPIPTTPIVNDVFIAILIAAVMGAFGSSLTYRAKGSSGGLDIIGFYRSQKNKGSLGSIYLIVNTGIYAICLLIYDVQIALYSLIYSTIYSFCLDKFHHHNIEVNVMIFTKNKEIKHLINNVIRRGVTHWDGTGGYTGDTMDVIVTIVSQSEVQQLRKVIKQADPKAFIILNENLKVEGGFEKRLI